MTRFNALARQKPSFSFPDEFSWLKLGKESWTSCVKLALVDMTQRSHDAMGSGDELGAPAGETYARLG